MAFFSVEYAFNHTVKLWPSQIESFGEINVLEAGKCRVVDVIMQIQILGMNKQEMRYTQIDAIAETEKKKKVLF